jgi:hypothetical protein
VDGTTWRIDGCLVELLEPPRRPRGYSS